jgi:hypothetical protein
MFDSEYKYAHYYLPTISEFSPYDHIFIDGVSTPAHQLPNEVLKYIADQRHKNATTSHAVAIKEIGDRISAIEDYLRNGLESRLQRLEDLVNKILTPIDTQFALNMTSDDKEVRKLADEIVQIKKSIGINNV